MLMQQLKYAVRTLTKARAFTVVAILTLSLGIGANVAMFSLINAVLLKPLPYRDADRLVFVNTLIPKLKTAAPMLPVRAGYVLRWRTELESFESMGAAIGTITNLTEARGTESLGTLRMTAELYDVLGQKPELGRWFRRTEEENEQPDVVVLSDRLWRREFGADAGILGRKILLDGKPHQVVGVAPPGVPFYRGQIDALLPEEPELYIPLRVPPGELDLTKVSSAHWCAVVGRLKKGVTLERARAETEVWMSAISRMNAEHLELHALVQPLQTALVGNARKGLLVLMAAVGFVLLIACVNTANLVLVRGTRTRRELAIRVVLGAGRRHVIVQCLMESLLIAVLGTVLGILSALWIIDFVITVAPTRLPRLEAVTVDANVFAFSLELCVLTTVLFGLLPAWNISRISMLGSLHSVGQRQTDGRRGGRLRAVLVSAEAGLTTLLLIGSGLLLASFHRVMNVPRGFETENTHAMVLALPQNKYQTLEQKVSFFRRVEESVASAPGIRQSGYANAIPLNVGESTGSRAPAVKEGSDGVAIAELPMASWVSVSTGYLSTLGIPLRSGRMFDQAEPRPAVLISETAARRIWPGEDPIGKKVRHLMDREKRHWFTVIGVVGDVHATALDTPVDTLIYYPYWQRYYSRSAGEKILVLYLRTPIEESALTATVRQRVRSVDPDVSISDRGTMARIVVNSVSQRRFQAVMVASFGLVALLLAAIGVYGVVSYSLEQRRKEIGIRIALGANQRDVASLVLRRGMQPILAGTGIGLVAAVAVAPVVQTLLFEVRALNPTILVAAPLSLVLVAALACYGPARRGSRTHPVDALRCD